MKLDRLVLTLAVGASVAFLAGCNGESPTGLDGTLDGTADSFGSMSLLNGTAPMCETITFDDETNNFAHADLVTVVNTQLFGPLTVTVEGYPNQSLDEARIYDTSTDHGNFDNDLEAPPGGNCTGCGAGDGLGNVLIIQQGDAVPAQGPADDSRTGGRVTFTGFSGGEFYIESFDALDDDSGQKFEARIDGTTLLAPESTNLGDGSVQTVTITTEHVFYDQFSLEYEGSGATDNIKLCSLVVERGEDGCTPGYWKQEQHWGSWAVPLDTKYGDVFEACWDADANSGAGDYAYYELQKPESGNLCSLTLLDGLSLRGGGVNAMARHAAAAYLNAASPDVEYYWTAGEIEDLVNEALTVGGIEDVHGQLADMNERYCPLGRSELPS